MTIPGTMDLQYTFSAAQCLSLPRTTRPRLAIYRMVYGSGTIELRKQQENFYFGGKMIRQDSPNLSETIATDRLGSVVGRNGTRYSYFPYGEEKGTPSSNDREKFGTYWRDSMTGWDYADQRYHFIHELGHVFNSLTGLGGSDFREDELNPDGTLNQAAVSFNRSLEDKCARLP